MKFRSQLLIFLAIASNSVFAQSWSDEGDYYESRRKGLEFALNMGVYQANNELYYSSANFYNGDGWYELGDNSATLYSIEERITLGTTAATIQNQLNTESVEIPLDAYSYNMRYDPAMMFGLKTSYFWSPESALTLGIDVASLKASGAYTMELDDLPGQGQGSDNIKLYGVFGEERRMLITTGFRTSFYITDQTSWIFELGGIATGTQVVRNYFNVENSSYDLITLFNGPGQFSGATSNLTNYGIGAYATLGLEALFEEGGNLEANLRISRDRIKLGSQEPGPYGVEGFSAIQWNAAIYVTWVIPNNVGEVIKASF